MLVTYLKKASCAISLDESRFEIFEEFIFLFCNINKTQIQNFEKLKVSETPYFAYNFFSFKAERIFQNTSTEITLPGSVFLK